MLHTLTMDPADVLDMSSTYGLRMYGLRGPVFGRGVVLPRADVGWPVPPEVRCAHPWPTPFWDVRSHVTNAIWGNLSQAVAVVPPSLWLRQALRCCFVSRFRFPS